MRPFSRTMFDLAIEQGERRKDAIAVISNGRSITYRDLAIRVRRVAAALQKQGVKRYDRIGLLISNRLEWVEICLGAGGAGASVVPFSTWSTRHELEFLLSDSEICFFFALARFGDRNFADDLLALVPEIIEGKRSARFSKLRHVVLLDGPTGDFPSYQAFLGEGDGANIESEIGAGSNDDGLILYTSGSSAKPKAVRLKHSGIIENGFNIGERQGFTESDRVLVAPPLFWSYGSANALSATLTHGATAVLQERFEPGEALELIERFKCTAIYTLPSMTSSMLHHPMFSRTKLGSLRTGLTIGSAQDFIDAAVKLGASQICNVYGATETYGNCCVTQHDWPLEKRANCQGHPLPGNEIRIVDQETGGIAAPGDPGLVEVRGYVTCGYSGLSSSFNSSVLTADGYYRTGDIGKIRPDGCFVFVGRSTEMIKRAGINVSPAEVEEVLLSHAAVLQAAVVGVPDRDKGELIVAFVVPQLQSVVTADQLLTHCRSIASKYKAPDLIELSSDLPVTQTGKLQRLELKKRAERLVQNSNGARHG